MVCEIDPFYNKLSKCGLATAESENEGSFVSSYVNMSLRHWRKRGVVYPSCKQDEKSHIQARKKAAVRTEKEEDPYHFLQAGVEK